MISEHLERSVTQTEDGSVTLFIPELEEHYHSIHGALQESKHVFIDAGLRCITKSDIHVLEAGFGTGLNVLLAFFESKRLGIKMNFITIEKYPLIEEEFSLLNYGPLVDEEDGEEVLQQLHHAPWGESVPISDHFTLTKYHVDMHDMKWSDLPSIDLVFYDAFAPDKQPDLWSDEMFAHVVRAMGSSAILTTYCAKGVVRRSLQAAGLLMERIPGPPGKREMLRGVKR
ncbi:tRNA (5-methylaminomethyl-2-thiouridine)(34)-methyltransferase MnmD [Halosquirtibacter laminarini]|uniref:tRNA (5-methylaminomethyl-2-thiouridine)(34)-methyltransferase MnmD n=1 Tax=Halosquirtibacter laminarini TaxID=3374600 RepID=A0AC61NGC1_9BACT|nr:tRNA (5-methylaminomethyl-2-thiouridine)(34)-methyltransferase MnmD [Prolixibacteraceae bacterium]